MDEEERKNKLCVAEFFLFFEKEENIEYIYIYINGCFLVAVRHSNEYISKWFSKESKKDNYL
tara:strand:- start:73 stop:258 length:186 start_codon:yes stop_codon:yes gene_type:complete